MVELTPNPYLHMSSFFPGVCFFGREGGGGGTALRHGHKESYADLNLNKFDLRMGLEPTTS